MRTCEPTRDPGAASFTELFNAHFHRVYANLRRLGVPEAAVDDALQEVFIVVLRRRDEAPLLSERAWILGVTRRIAHRWRRGAARRRRLTEALSHEPREPLDGAGAVAQQQATRLLEQFLGRLDDDKREVFVLAELEQLTAPEIAEALQLNINTVYSRLRAARQVFDRSFARARLRDARSIGEAPPQVILLSHARAAYAPGSGAQARVFALLAPLLWVPGAAAHAGELADALPSLPGPTMASHWAAWTASLGLAGALAAGLIGAPPGPVVEHTTDLRAVKEPSAQVDRTGGRSIADIEISTITTTPEPARQPGEGWSRAPLRGPGKRPGAPATPAPEAAPAAAAMAPADPLQREAALLARARTALRGADPATAQALLDRHAHEFPDGALTDERRLSQIAALCLSRQIQRARDEAERLTQERPAMAVRAAAMCREFSATDAAGSGD